jgi:hypothetical protein
MKFAISRTTVTFSDVIARANSTVPRLPRALAFHCAKIERLGTSKGFSLIHADRPCDIPLIVADRAPRRWRD